VVLEHARVARHRVRAPDHAMADAVRPGKSCEIETPLELMGLHSNKREQSRLIRVAQKIEVIKIRLDVLVDRDRFDRNAIN